MISTVSFDIGVCSAILTRVLVRTLAATKRAAHWLLQMFSAAVKPASTQEREENSFRSPCSDDLNRES